jgi:release factor glutamine methyltransferase
MSKTIIDVIKLGTDYLHKKNIESSRLNMELILCDVLKCERIELYSKYDKPLNEKEIATAREKMLKIADGVPIQYALGTTKFLNFHINVNKNVLIPRPETELIIELIKKDYPQNDQSYNILDIGCGSGCISIALAEYFKNSKVFAIDISDEAIDTAKANADINGVKNIEFYNLNILKKIPKTKFDIIVSNPPYISISEYGELESNVKEYEPRLALTDDADGYTFYSRFSQIFKGMLNPDGVFYLEIGWGQAERIISMFGVTNFLVDVSKDLSGISRIIRGKINTYLAQG